MQDLEKRTSDEELLSQSIEKAKIYQRKSFRSFILYGLIPAVILAGAALYLTYEKGINQLERSHQQCEQDENKSTIRSTPFGRYSCNEIKELYKKSNQ